MASSKKFKMKFLKHFVIIYLTCISLASSVSNTRAKFESSVQFRKQFANTRNSVGERDKEQEKTRNNPRTFGMMDRIFESMGMSSITMIPGLRSLMEMNINGTHMEFIPLGRILWNRFFGDGATNTILGL